MAAQASDEDRRTVATYVVDNAGTEPDLDARVALLWHTLASALPDGDKRR